LKWRSRIHHQRIDYEFTDTFLHTIGRDTCDGVHDDHQQEPDPQCDLSCDLHGFDRRAFLMFNAQFLAIVQIIVYAGAIMVLFLFTIMLMNLNKEDEPHKSIASKLAAAVSFCLLALVLLAAFIKAQPVIAEYDTTGEDFQSIKILGQVLLDDKNGFMVPFEFASILLLVAMIGAVLLSKKEKQLR
jgi:NADH-quinone oxidoreductase subunit J